MMIVSEPLPHFVDDLLGYLHETHPTHATLDGVHAFDDHLEDLSRHAIESEIRALAGYMRRLDEINPEALTAVERLEHRMLSANLQARTFELEVVRTWERNPQYYADILASSLAGQALFTHAPMAERARRALSKLRQTPRLIQAARDNIKDPPGIFVKVGIETMRGALKFIERDLPRAFGDLDDLHLLGDLADAQAEASQAIGAYIDVLEREVAPKARASFRLGRDKFEQKLRLDEGLTIPVDRLLAIATRELAATQEEFKSAAGRMNGGDPLAAWARTKAEHPAPGELVKLFAPHVHQLAGSGMVGLRARPGLERIAAVDPPRDALKGLLRFRELTRGDRQQPVERHRNAFIEPQLLLQLVAAQPERCPRLRRDLGLEVLEIRTDRVRRLGLRVGEIRQQVQIVQIGKRPGQVAVDELQRPADGLDADLDEDARWLLDVVARRLNQPRRLAQLREHPPRPFGRGRIGEQHLAGEARGENVGIELRIAFPGPHHFQLEHARLQMIGEHPVLKPLDRCQRLPVDLVEPPEIPGQGVDFTVNRMPADVLQVVIVRVDAVEGRMGGMGLVEVAE